MRTYVHQIYFTEVKQYERHRTRTEKGSLIGFDRA